MLRNWAEIEQELTQLGIRAVQGGQWFLGLVLDEPLTGEQADQIFIYYDQFLEVRDHHVDQRVIDENPDLSRALNEPLAITGVFPLGGSVVQAMSRFMAALAGLGVSASVVKFTFDEERDDLTQDVREFAGVAGEASWSVVWPWLLLLLGAVGSYEYLQRR